MKKFRHTPFPVGWPIVISTQSSGQRTRRWSLKKIQLFKSFQAKFSPKQPTKLTLKVLTIPLMSLQNQFGATTVYQNQAGTTPASCWEPSFLQRWRHPASPEPSGPLGETSASKLTLTGQRTCPWTHVGTGPHPGRTTFQCSSGDRDVQKHSSVRNTVCNSCANQW